ncbi:SAM-dependent DNA methyltransferase [Blastococcus saxobsidens]|uniref:site-specific DNA-methyltransferase (adenine-specific) n=1 Tax=Blastococcus saxobsidens TaxID=138336 RepID=A0A6L9W4W5_9ACTN|nr:class I SAM-dependent DNA methyltransferase [Blastococcus saxobsidens]NEK87048.1 SAM-dependent DNA methyltransferase [Blastococcus saxobsidens]
MPAAKPTASLSAVIKRARDVMRKDAGLNGDADRIPQFAWLLFLKALDDLDESREVTDPEYRPALASPYRWRDWAADSTTRRSGDALLTFVNQNLLPHLAGLTGSGAAGDTRETVAAIFRDTRNRMLSGYLLADLVDEVNKVSFVSADDVHTMAHLYESMLREMRDAAGDAGEFYTPRPVIRFMVNMLDPRPGEVVMDPAAGTGGFLVEAWDHMVRAADASETPAQQRAALRGTLRGFEKKPMPYLLGQMNLLLHEVDSPRITRGNALTFSAADQRRDGVDVVLTNPPFGGEEEVGVKDYFKTDYRTAETSWLFLLSVMERIAKSKTGRAAIVVPNAVLFDEGIGARIKARLLEEFNLHTIVRLPIGTFSPYTLISTNILFFERGGPTRSIWFYEHPLPQRRRSYTKTKPLRYEELADCEAWWGSDGRVHRVETSNAWNVPVTDLNNFDLDLHSPNRPDDLAHRPPVELIAELIDTETQILGLLERMQAEMAGRQ